MNSSNGVTLITATSDRPAAFRLCECWIRRQTYSGPLQWIVVDDGREPVRCTAGQEHIRLAPVDSVRESFRHNNLAGLEAARYNKVLWIEDDDWYHPNYIGLMAAMLDIKELVGCARARYYNVRHRVWRIQSNRSHASLCQTGIQRSLLPIARDILERSNFAIPSNPEQLDGTLWKRSRIADSRKLLLPETAHVVGIKGMPGKGGLGVGHRENDRMYRNHVDGSRDPDGQTLREWIGDDADIYRNLFSPGSDDLPHAKQIGQSV